MCDGPQKSPKRLRREWEDTLLHGRTAIFLVLNGFAVQKATLPVVGVIAVLDCLWVLASVQSWIVISELVIKSPGDGAQSVVDESLGTRLIHRLFRPTTIVSLWIPTVTYAGWLSFIGVECGSYQVWVAMAAAMAMPFLIIWGLRSSRTKA